MIVQSIGFSPEEVEITYLEDPEAKAGVIELRTLIISKSTVPEAYADLVDSAEALVDAALVARRNPVGSFRGSR